MKFALFLTCSWKLPPSGDLADWFAQDVAPVLRENANGLTSDLFVPDEEGGDVLHFDDPERPDLIIQFTGYSAAQLSEFVIQNRLLEAVSDMGSRESLETTAGMFRIHETPVSDNPEPLPRVAGMSFVVRYFGPTKDNGAFAAHYAANHPPIMARFPGIRNVFCYVPVAWKNPGFDPSPVIVGNEVVFDNVDALNLALESDVLADLRADLKGFPEFGHNTHHAMHRCTLF